MRLMDFKQMMFIIQPVIADTLKKKHWDELDKAGLVGKNLLQGMNDYKDGGIFYGLFLAPKIKYCLTINKHGVIDEHKTFKGFTNVSDNLDRKENFNISNGDKLIAKEPLSWKKSISMRVVIPHKMRNCTDCKEDILCDECDELVNQRKEFSANLNEMKREKLLTEMVICFLSIQQLNHICYLLNGCKSKRIL